MSKVHERVRRIERLLAARSGVVTVELQPWVTALAKQPPRTPAEDQKALTPRRRGIGAARR